MTGPLRLRHRVGREIALRGLWGRGDRVAVALSGGLDSVCLLDLLLETDRWHGGRLEVVTVDHGVRPGSGADADFALELARARGLPARRVDLRLGEGASEEACRVARYDALDALDVERVALGHHRDDQAETLLLAAMRGAGSAGLAGMAWRRGRYVRPLLGLTRADLGAWAARRGLRWVEDPTNADPRFLRNRVRHELLPLLERLRPGAAAALARSASLLALDAAALDEIVAADPRARPGLEGWEIAWLVGAPEALARRALLAALPGAESRHVEAALAAARAGRGAVGVPGGALRVRGDRLVFVREVEPPAPG